MLTESTSTQLLLGLILETEGPLWLRVAAGNGWHVAYELVPDGISQTLELLIPDQDKREAYLLARARVFDAAERSQIGEEAEAAVVMECRQELFGLGETEKAMRVVRVSLISDELGYDVTAPKVSSGIRRLEVKGTRTRGSDVVIYLSRNEFETGVVDKDWSLVVVRLIGMSHEILGWISASALESIVPQDRHDSAQWQSARVRLHAADLHPFLPSPS